MGSPHALRPWAYLCEEDAQEHAAEPGVTGVGTGQRLIESPA